MSFKRFFPLLSLLIISITLMTYQSNKGSLAPSNLFSRPLNYINNLTKKLLTSAKEPFRKVMVRDEENMTLKKEVDRLTSEQQRYREIFFENQRLRDILQIKEREKKYVSAARVISRGWDNWSNSIVIDRGSKAGIQKNMAAVTPKGLIGKVVLVTENYSNVLLITDINFSASVKVQETRKEAIISGTGLKRCVMKYVAQEDAIEKGWIIVTSGLDELFPPEIPVGYIYSVDKNIGLFQNITVKPFQDPSALDEVIIVSR